MKLDVPERGRFICKFLHPSSASQALCYYFRKLNMLKDLHKYHDNFDKVANAAERCNRTL